MSSLSMTHQAFETLRGVLHMPARAQAQAAASRERSRSWMDRLDEWFDGFTDDRAELERYLARAQNLADLEIRMRDALYSRAPLRF